MGYLALVLLLFWSCVRAPRVVVAKTPDVSATAGLRESITTSLGDGSTTAESTRDLMQEVDTNNDGDISRTEVRQYINDTGGEALDRRDKVVHAAGLSFDAMDGNGDRDLTKLELNDYWRSVANLLSVHEVAEWASHAMQLPQALVDKFVSMGVTGYDFPELLANDGQLLVSELGIGLNSVRQRIMRGMRMKLMGMGTVPHPVSGGEARATSCLHSTIVWSPAAVNTAATDIPVHKFVLQRQLEATFFGASAGPVKWETIYGGLDTEFVDVLSWDEATDPSRGRRRARFYRVTAWNMIGRAEYLYIDEQKVSADVSTCVRSVAGRLNHTNRDKSGRKGERDSLVLSGTGAGMRASLSKQAPSTSISANTMPGPSPWGVFWELVTIVTTTVPLSLQMLTIAGAVCTLALTTGRKIMGRKLGSQRLHTFLDAPQTPLARSTSLEAMAYSLQPKHDPQVTSRLGPGLKKSPSSQDMARLTRADGTYSRQGLKHQFGHKQHQEPLLPPTGGLRRSQSLTGSALKTPSFIRRLTGLRMGSAPVGKLDKSRLGFLPSVTVDTAPPLVAHGVNTTMSVGTSPIHADISGEPIVPDSATLVMSSPLKQFPSSRGNEDSCLDDDGKDGPCDAARGLSSCPSSSTFPSSTAVTVARGTKGSIGTPLVRSGTSSKPARCLLCDKKFKTRVLTASRRPVRCARCATQVCEACFDLSATCCKTCASASS